MLLGQRLLEGDGLSTHGHGHQAYFSCIAICFIFICADRLLVLAQPVTLAAQIDLIRRLASGCKNIINIKITEETLLIGTVVHLHRLV